MPQSTAELDTTDTRHIETAALDELDTTDTRRIETPELDALHLKLKRTRRQAGDPSFRVLARLSPVQQSATTVSRMFNAPGPPSWPKLKGLLLALGVPPEQISTEWRPQWRRAADEAHPVTDKPDRTGKNDDDDEPLTLVSYEDLACRKCGSRIDDAALHSRFHQSLDRTAAMVRLLERASKRRPV